MSADQIDKAYTLRPHWKHFFWKYLLAVIAIPLAGIGLLYFYFLRKKQRQISYVLTDDQVKTVHPSVEQHVDLVDIGHITLTQSWFRKKLGVGTLILQTSTDDVFLRGLEHPARLKALLEKAIQNKKNQLEKQKPTKPREPEYKPGQMQQLEYLTGLWQQGLITEEEFEHERNQL